MTEIKMFKEKLEHSKISSKKITGDRFDDLTEEQMEEIQGQGGSNDVKTRGIWDILTSSGKYTCR